MATKIGPCLLIILTTVWIINGFSTKKCNHNQLSDQLGKFTSCLNLEFLELVGQLLKDYKSQLKANNNSYDLTKGCPVIQKHSDNVAKCAMSLTSSCLDANITNLAKHVFIGAGIVCKNFEYVTRGFHPSFQSEKLKGWVEEYDRQSKTKQEIYSQTSFKSNIFWRWQAGDSFFIHSLSIGQ